MATKKQIKKYFHDHPGNDVGDAAYDLDLPLQAVVSIVQELKEEGLIVPKGRQFSKV